MSRKHFEALAAAIAESYLEACQDTHNEAARAAVATLAGRIARACANDNPRFDDKRFLAACGITTSGVIICGL